MSQVGALVQFAEMGCFSVDGDEDKSGKLGQGVPHAVAGLGGSAGQGKIEFVYFRRRVGQSVQQGTTSTFSMLPKALSSLPNPSILILKR